MARLFVAVWPPAPLLEVLAALPRPSEPGVRWIPAPNWHVTLRFVGTAEAAVVAAALAGAALPRTTLRLGPTVERLGSRLVVVPIAGADELARAVHSCTAGIGQPARREFKGHLTLARTEPHATTDLIGAPIDRSFAVERVALVSSDLKPTGSTYTTIATFDTV